MTPFPIRRPMVHRVQDRAQGLVDLLLRTHVRQRCILEMRDE